MLEPADVLLLDEPTNDLDIPTLEVLEDNLAEFAGGLVLVTHDRLMLERVADHQVALLGDGRVRDLPGGVDEYLRLRASFPGRALDGTEIRPPTARIPTVPPASSAAEVRAARKEMVRIERRLDRIGEEEARLHEELVRNAADHQAVLRLDVDLRALQGEREDLEMEWLSAAETAG